MAGVMHLDQSAVAVKLLITEVATYASAGIDATRAAVVTAGSDMMAHECKFAVAAGADRGDAKRRPYVAARHSTLDLHGPWVEKKIGVDRELVD